MAAIQSVVNGCAPSDRLCAEEKSECGWMDGLADKLVGALVTILVGFATRKGSVRFGGCGEVEWDQPKDENEEEEEHEKNRNVMNELQRQR